MEAGGAMGWEECHADTGKISVNTNCLEVKFGRCDPREDSDPILGTVVGGGQSLRQ